jgi:hypothetical protein
MMRPVLIAALNLSRFATRQAAATANTSWKNVAMPNPSVAWSDW